MKQIVEAGSDGATLCFFDPAALPANFDTELEQDSIGLMESLQKQQLFWFGDTGADGGYIFHVYLNEAAPKWLENKGTVLETFERFFVPSGQLWICGAEYAASDPLLGSNFSPNGGLEKYSGMGDVVNFEPGFYHITVLSIEYSKQERKTSQQSVLSKTQLAWHRWLERLMAVFFVLGGIGLLFSVAMIVILSFTTLYNVVFKPDLLNGLPEMKVWIAIAIGAGAMFGLAAVLNRFSRNSATTQLLNAAKREQPDYLIIARITEAL